MQLLREYPFLEMIHGSYQSQCRSYGCEFNPTIKVKRGDPNLMFRQADDVDGISQWIGDPEDSSVRGASYEFYRPVNREGQLGSVHDWQKYKDHYVRNLFSERCYDWCGTGVVGGEDPFEVVDSVVWVTEDRWLPADAGDRARPVRINLRITIYKEPKKGWRELYRRADPLVNVKMNGWRLITGPNLRDSFREVVYDRLGKLGQEFQEKVWETGLGKVVNDSRMKGMSGQYGTVKILTYIIAGRMTIQFERGDTMFNLAGLDNVDDPRLSFGAIYGTVPQAEKLVRDAIKFWESADEKTRQNVHRDNPEVGLGI
jgi:hypothetical protein